jgi:DNA replication protein DnaC
LGHDIETRQEVRLGDIERRSGTYILGKPGMGKSGLMVNLTLQDIHNGHSVFFLDPHADAINDLVKRMSRDKP